MKINESESDNAKFLSEFLFWIVAVAGQYIIVVVEETIQYSYSTIKTINQSLFSHHMYGSGAPRPASAIASITLSFASRLYVRMVSP